MFNIDPSELMLLGAVALVVIGPKDLPRAMRFVGQWVGRARGMARHFRMGVDEIIRQAELDEMQKKWAAENARIMAEHPMPPPEEADDAALAYGGEPPVMTPLPAPASAESTAWPPHDRDDWQDDVEQYVPPAPPAKDDQPSLFGPSGDAAPAESREAPKS
jgi:sec-independent protein translocase protein TatB